MNRNTESYFATVPSLDIQRSSFDRSQDIKFSFNVGNLVPFFWDEVLPGDTFSVETSKVVRLQTLLTPVMDNIYLDTYFFFVPYRLCWTHWKQFMGENTESAWLPETEYTIPQLQTGHMYNAETYTKPGFPVSSTEDYLGVPVGVDLSVSALPYRAYQLIWDQWFRDENLQNPENIYLGDAVSYHAYADADFEPPYSDARYPVAKYHDYFTSALPAPLKGDPVLAPVSGNAPVGSLSSIHNFGSNPLGFGLTLYSDGVGVNKELYLGPNNTSDEVSKVAGFFPYSELLAQTDVQTLASKNQTLSCGSMLFQVPEDNYDHNEHSTHQ